MKKSLSKNLVPKNRRREKIFSLSFYWKSLVNNFKPQATVEEYLEIEWRNELNRYQHLPPSAYSYPIHKSF